MIRSYISQSIDRLKFIINKLAVGSRLKINYNGNKTVKIFVGQVRDISEYGIKISGWLSDFKFKWPPNVDIAEMAESQIVINSTTSFVTIKNVGYTL